MAKFWRCLSFLFLFLQLCVLLWTNIKTRIQISHKHSFACIIYKLLTTSRTTTMEGDVWFQRILYARYYETFNISFPCQNSCHVCSRIIKDSCHSFTDISKCSRSFYRAFSSAVGDNLEKVFAFMNQLRGLSYYLIHL